MTVWGFILCLLAVLAAIVVFAGLVWISIWLLVSAVHDIWRDLDERKGNE